MNYRLTALILAALPPLAACDDDDDDVTGPQQISLVQFVNASPGTADARVTVNDELLTSNLDFPGASDDCVPVPIGDRILTFEAGGADIAVADEFAFQQGERYTVLLTGTGDAREAMVLEENFTAPAAGNVALRFVNATSGAADIYVTTPDGALGENPDVAGLDAGAVTGGTTGTGAWTSFAEANTRVRLFAEGTTETPIATWDLAALDEDETGATIVFAEDAEGDVTAFQFEQCDD